MRLDKFLKTARIIKRRTVANEVCSAGRVKLNDRVAKPGSEVSVNDIIEIQFGSGSSRLRILEIKEHVRKDEASQLYEIIGSDDPAAEVHLD